MADIVIVATFADQTEAIVARSLLEHEGIECLLLGENELMAQPYLLSGSSALRLQVYAKDERLARELLNVTDEPSDLAGPMPACPSCGSISSRPTGGLLQGLLSLFGASSTSLKMRCNRCSHTWQAKEDQ